MDYQDYETLKVTSPKEGLLRVSLNIPAKLNAMNNKMIEELGDITAKLKKDKSYSVVIMTGEGEKGFCGGLDVKEVFNPEVVKSVDTFYGAQLDLGQIMLNMRQMPQVIIAAAFGWCVGGGFIMPMASDIRVITEDVKFSAPFVKIKMGGGDLGTSYFLWHELGSGVASDLLLTGRNLEADEAMRLGFASRCVDTKEELDAAAEEIADGLLKIDPTILELTKEILNANMNAGSLEDCIMTEHRNQQMIISKLWRGAK